MDLPPSYNEAVASAPPIHSYNGEGYPPARGQPPPTGFVVPQPIPAVSETAVLTLTETVHVLTPKLGPQSSEVTCPTCHKHVRTTTDTMANTKTHLIALVLFIIGCWPCCLIPYCVDSCMTIKHSCPSCGAFLGYYSG